MIKKLEKWIINNETNIQIGSEGKEWRKPCLDGVASLSKCNLLFALIRKFDGLVANYMEVANVVVDCRGTTLVGVTGMCRGGGFEVKEATTKVDDVDEDTYWLSSLRWLWGTLSKTLHTTISDQVVETCNSMYKWTKAKGNVELLKKTCTNLA